MAKIDLKKRLKPLYGTTAHNGFVVVDVSQMNYLMIDGEGDPNTAQSHADAVQALYSVSYALKFMVKRSEIAVDYGVMPLEALWWTDKMADFSVENKDMWKWTAMIMQPEWADAALVAEALATTAKKKALSSLSQLRFEGFSEGPSAQCLYVGPYSEEAATIQELHQFISDQGGDLGGKHHEI